MTEYTIEDVTEMGIALGQELFTYNISDVKGYETIMNNEADEDFDWDEFKDRVYELCSEASDNYRQYSPFEFFAHDLNEAENSDELWEAYDDAITDGIQMALDHFLVEYTQENSHE